MLISLRTTFTWLLVSLWCGGAYASVGMTELPANVISGPVTVFYPTSASSKVVQRGDFQVDVALDADPLPGNRKLIVISHGSPASPWVYLDLVRVLVDAGFTVALPEHFADNYKDDSEPGPPSWRRRPFEVSKAIDRLQQSSRFCSTLDFSRVGMFGMSAGGHTALTLAGGRWSPSRLRDHCQRNLENDFHACAGLTTELTGGVLDSIKKFIVRTVDNRKFGDTTWYEHTDSRIVAIVAGVPFAADFDPESLRVPKVALAIVSARGDQWLKPQFHSDAVLAVCQPCEHLADLSTGGHGALLGPLPSHLPSLVAKLIGDPEGFNRKIEVPKLNKTITDYFLQKLI